MGEASAQRAGRCPGSFATSSAACFFSLFHFFFSAIAYTTGEAGSLGVLGSVHCAASNKYRVVPEMLQPPLHDHSVQAMVQLSFPPAWLGDATSFAASGKSRAFLSDYFSSNY